MIHERWSSPPQERADPRSFTQSATGGTLDRADPRSGGERPLAEPLRQLGLGCRWFAAWSNLGARVVPILDADRCGLAASASSPSATRLAHDGRFIPLRTTCLDSRRLEMMRSPGK